MRTPLLMSSAFALVVATTSAQQPPPPPSISPAAPTPARDAPARPSVGTASLAGTVVLDERTNTPLRRALVTLAPAGSGFTITRSTMTDEQGRFAFTRLPSGSYTSLRATKNGYVPTAFGQKRPGGMGTPVTLAEGQRVTATIRMLRGAVITGTVLDDRGRPAQQVQVQASPVRTVDGIRQPASSGSFRTSAQTDDRGVYRIYGLSPGDYVVVATPQAPNSEDIHQVTPEEIRWTQQQLQSNGLAAQGAGAANSPPVTALTLPPGPAVTYTPIYYPGTPDASAATLVAVAAGEERSGVDFLTQFVKTAKIQGTVIDVNGEPGQNVQISVIPKVDPIALNSPSFLNTLFSTRPAVTNGKFTIPALRPGEYTISARATPAGPSLAPAPGAGPTAPPPVTWAAADVSVNGDDQNDLTLRLAPGMTITGQIKFEGTTLQPPVDLTRVNLRMTAAPSAGGMTVTVNLSPAQIKPDGSFTFSSVIPGRYMLAATTAAANPTPGVAWTAKSAMIGGVDAIDLPFEIKPGQNVSNSLVTFTDAAAEVSGTLTDAAGKPTSEFSVILFVADKHMWIPRSRRLRQPVRTGADGKFKFTGLAPGDYFVAALTDFEPGDLSNPAFLEQVQASAIKISVGEGEKKTQDLKLAGGV